MFKQQQRTPAYIAVGMDICLHIFAHKHLISSTVATGLLIKDVTQFQPVLPVEFYQLALDHLNMDLQLER